MKQRVTIGHSPLLVTSHRPAQQIFGWFSQFKLGKFSLKDDDRSGRPATSLMDENTKSVQKC